MQQKALQQKRVASSGARAVPHLAMPVAFQTALNKKRAERLEAQRRDANGVGTVSIGSVDGTVENLRSVIVHTGVEKQRSKETGFSVRWPADPDHGAFTCCNAALALMLAPASCMHACRGLLNTNQHAGR